MVGCTTLILLFVFSAGWLTMLAVRVLPGVRQDAFDVSELVRIFVEVVLFCRVLSARACVLSSILQMANHNSLTAAISLGKLDRFLIILRNW